MKIAIRKNLCYIKSAASEKADFGPGSPLSVSYVG
jgi:hypothetical protein